MPEQTAGDKDVLLLGEDGIEPTLNHDDVLELQRVFGHRLSIAIGIDNRLGLDQNRHANHPCKVTKQGGFPAALSA
jgi:hypothetical protein